MNSSLPVEETKKLDKYFDLFRELKKNKNKQKKQNKQTVEHGADSFNNHNQSTMSNIEETWGRRIEEAL